MSVSDEIRHVLREVVEPAVRVIHRLEARLETLEDRTSRLLAVIEKLITGEEGMAKIHDDIKAALADNQTDISSNEAKLTTLIAMKGESDVAFQDILDAVKEQGQSINAIGKALDAALDSEKTASEAVAKVAEAPVADATGADTRQDGSSSV